MKAETQISQREREKKQNQGCCVWLCDGFSASRLNLKRAVADAGVICGGRIVFDIKSRPTASVRLSVCVLGCEH